MPIPFIITTAGLDALVDAENGDTDPIVITEVGLTEAAVDAAPTLEALPGEFKRLNMVSGESVAPNVIHLTAQDPSTDVYALRGLALYLADGTLFAAYGQETPIFTKVNIATFLLATDVTFSSDVADSIEFGDAIFLYPPATETVKGVAELATQAEADAGTDDTRIVTPLKLKVVLDVIRNAVTALVNRTITGGGLVTGGGNLSANRVLSVEAASLVETNAAAIGNKVVVPSGLAGIIGNIAAKAASAITITGGGLVTGGGDLTANRVLTVTEASAGDITAGTSTTTVVTPRRLGPISMLLAQNGYIRFFGLQLCWGRFSATGNGSTPVTFPIAFPNACFVALVSGTSNTDTGHQDEDATVVTSSITASGFTAFNATDTANSCTYFAVGN